MFSIFSKRERILGLDITEEYIRFVELLKTRDKNIMISFGEEKIAQKEPVNGLTSALRSIKKKTKTSRAQVCLPPYIARFEIAKIKKCRQEDILPKIQFALTEDNSFSYDEAVMFYEKKESINDEEVYRVMVSSRENAALFRSVFLNSGIDIVGFSSHRDALISSCLPEGCLINSMVVNIERDISNFAIYYPFNEIMDINLKIAKEDIGKAIKEIYINFYKENNQKISSVFAVGSLSSDKGLLNYMSRETRINIDEGDVFTNIFLAKNDVPPIPKEESLKYAIAIGLAVKD